MHSSSDSRVVVPSTNHRPPAQHPAHHRTAPPSEAVLNQREAVKIAFALTTHQLHWPPTRPRAQGRASQPDQSDWPARPFTTAPLPSPLCIPRSERQIISPWRSPLPSSGCSDSRSAAGSASRRRPGSGSCRPIAIQLLDVVSQCARSCADTVNVAVPDCPGFSVIRWNPLSWCGGSPAEAGIADVQLGHLGAGAASGVGDRRGHRRLAVGQCADLQVAERERACTTGRTRTGTAVRRCSASYQR